MILKLCFIHIMVIQIHGFRGPTFRSSIMEGNKPILRMPQENSVEQIAENSPEESSRNEPLWVKELRDNIKQLVHQLGHQKAKPYIIKLVKETEDTNNVLLHVEVSGNGVSDIKYKYQMRASYHDSYIDYDNFPHDGSWITKAHPIMTPEPDPQWLADLKVFIKELIGRYGKRRLDEFVTPVIKAIQKQHNVIIKDIDVDHYGEVYVNYINRSPFHTPWISGRKRRTRKQHESTSESDISEQEDFRGVTEIPMEEK